MKYCVLISCMHEKDHSIIERSNVQSDCVVVNQCDQDKIDEFEFINKFGEKKHCTFIFTTERGLSRSRNMAIAYAPEDAICQLCDDDEILEENVESIVLDEYKKYSDATLIAFTINSNVPNYKVKLQKEGQMSYLQSLRVSSVQITFSKPEIRRLGVIFDINKGSGTNNGAGEENKFVIDIRKARGKMFFSTKCIATLNPGTSQWFKGYNKEYMIKDGRNSRDTFGPIIGFLYCNHWVVKHYKLYKSNISFLHAWYFYMKGYFSK